MVDKVYVLTERVNDYNQYGEYFLGVFKNVPTLSEVNTCAAYFEKISNEQYEFLIKNGYLQYLNYHEFLYLKEVNL